MVLSTVHPHRALEKPLWAPRGLHTSLKTAGLYVLFKLGNFFFFLNKVRLWTPAFFSCVGGWQERSANGPLDHLFQQQIFAGQLPCA